MVVADPPKPETTHSEMAGDLRQSQLAALALKNVGMTTAVDTGDWSNVQQTTLSSLLSHVAPC